VNGPSWLAELQARFGDVLRAPLDRSTGTLTATPASYDPRLVELVAEAHGVSGPERLAIYQRQYWCRLFEVVQRAYPLVTALLGPWELNGRAARFLVARPPRSWDLDEAPDGFDAFLAAQGDPGDADLAPLCEAARIDAAWRQVFGAPEAPRLELSAADAARLPNARLVASPAVALVLERWPLLELRRRVMAGPSSERRTPLPPPLPQPRCWALVRTGEAVGQLPLEPGEAELLELLRGCTVSEALGRLEQACPPEERATLPAKAQGWLARSVQLRFWIGTC
jgi:hypothetical protein